MPDFSAFLENDVPVASRSASPTDGRPIQYGDICCVPASITAPFLDLIVNHNPSACTPDAREAFDALVHADNPNLKIRPCIICDPDITSTSPLVCLMATLQGSDLSALTPLLRKFLVPVYPTSDLAISDEPLRTVPPWSGRAAQWIVALMFRLPRTETQAMKRWGKADIRLDTGEMDRLLSVCTAKTEEWQRQTPALRRQEEMEFLQFRSYRLRVPHIFKEPLTDENTPPQEGNWRSRPKPNDPDSDWLVVKHRTRSLRPLRKRSTGIACCLLAYNRARTPGYSA
ncbi:hypothetical protein PLICRDRAFT_126173 [Plicaturopsis crispa FD-325 SS-3]|nr:hypothetical protein PLICRDRAFT_126173 [Plicaturopsis crispa FD-325 SS-3]